MKDSCRNVWSVLIKALLLQCTIRVVHYNRSNQDKKSEAFIN